MKGYNHSDKTTRYAIGQQDFRILRESGALYVDKTQFIEKIIKSHNLYYFLARPRRFGKSLFLSTLRYFFEGRRELFIGLHIDASDWDWQRYPVLHLDLNPNHYDLPDNLDSILDFTFSKMEREFDIPPFSDNHSLRFRNIIEKAYEKSGRRVVILIDEYDKPLVGNLYNDKVFELNRTKLSSIYGNLKSAAEFIKLTFITGVSRFSKLSVFSDLNNLKDISFSDEYAEICGITQTELHRDFSDGIHLLAENLNTDHKAILELLKKNYDGYRFSRRGKDIYNPWSVLNAMDESAIEDYWVHTGVPRLIAEVMREQDVDVEDLLNTECTMSTLFGLDLQNADPLALLYQTGYLTIKHYDEEAMLYRLGIPNREVTRGLLNILLPYYVSTRRKPADRVVTDILKSIRRGDAEGMMKNLDIFLAGIPYEMKMEDENNIHNALYILLRLIGADVNTEVHTSDGRIDLLITTDKYIYIIELKYGKDAASAIAQTDDKLYDLRFRNDDRQIIRIGANFNPSTRRFDSPAIR